MEDFQFNRSYFSEFLKGIVISTMLLSFVHCKEEKASAAATPSQENLTTTAANQTTKPEISKVTEKTAAAEKPEPLKIEANIDQLQQFIQELCETNQDINEDRLNFSKLCGFTFTVDQHELLIRSNQRYNRDRIELVVSPLRLEFPGNVALSNIPESIGNITSLQSIDLQYHNLKTLPESIQKLTGLTYLNLEGAQLISLPTWIGKLNNLVSFNASYVHETEESDAGTLQEIPAWIENLKKLSMLDFAYNQVSVFPDSICKLEKLETLFLEENVIQKVPTCLDQLKNLKGINLSYNKITELPDSFYNLSPKIQIDLKHNPLSEKTKAKLRESKLNVYFSEDIE